MSAPARTHVVIGEPAQVRSVLELAHTEGRLMGVTGAALLAPGRVRVTADLVDPAPVRSRWQRIRPWLIRSAVLLAVVAAGTALWLLVLAVIALVSTVVAAVTAVVAWITAHWMVLALVLVGLVLLLGGGSACRGLHCGGCRG